jgi:hypothetical protein
MSLLDGKGPKTIRGSIAKDLRGDGRKTNYIKTVAEEFGESKPKKRRK